MKPFPLARNGKPSKPSKSKQSLRNRPRIQRHAFVALRTQLGLSGEYLRLAPPRINNQASATCRSSPGAASRRTCESRSRSCRKSISKKQISANQIALDVKTALLNLQSARKKCRVANLGVQLAKEEVDPGRDRFFKAGVAKTT